MAANPTPTPPDRDRHERDEPGDTRSNPTGVSTEAPAEGAEDAPGGVQDRKTRVAEVKS